MKFDFCCFLLNYRYAYSALTEMVWGKTTGRIINFLIDVSVFCSNIPALLIGKALLVKQVILICQLLTVCDKTLMR